MNVAAYGFCILRRAGAPRPAQALGAAASREAACNYGILFEHNLWSNSSKRRSRACGGAVRTSASRNIGALALHRSSPGAADRCSSLGDRPSAAADVSHHKGSLPPAGRTRARLKGECGRAGTHSRAALLFAARSRAERLFATQLEGLAREHPERLRVSIHTTREPPQPAAVAAGPGIVGGAQGRIGESDLETALRWIGCEANAVLERRAVPWQDTRARQPGTAALATAATAAYVCGPARMTDDVVGTLKRMGVPHVYSEQWW